MYFEYFDCNGTEWDKDGLSPLDDADLKELGQDPE